MHREPHVHRPTGPVFSTMAFAVAPCLLALLLPPLLLLLLASSTDEQVHVACTLCDVPLLCGDAPPSPILRR
jgi:hypothetical protein